MPSKCASFGIANDEFGKHVQINYKGRTYYGTAIGGYVSLLISLVTWTLALGQIWACFFSILNYEWQKEGQLDSPNLTTYTIPYSEGFPSFSIYAPTSGDWTDPSNLQGVYNDKDYFDFYFVGAEGESQIDAIPCIDALNKYISDVDTVQDISLSYGSEQDGINFFVCPDKEDYPLYQQNWNQFGLTDTVSLSFVAKVKTGQESYAT